MPPRHLALPELARGHRPSLAGVELTPELVADVSLDLGRERLALAIVSPHDFLPYPRDPYLDACWFCNAPRDALAHRPRMIGWRHDVEATHERLRELVRARPSPPHSRPLLRRLRAAWAAYVAPPA